MTDMIVTPNVSDTDATFYGVYLGEPGDFIWQADFSYKSDALDWAWKLATLHNWELQDKTFKEAA
jgi:hypothetical protein